MCTGEQKSIVQYKKRLAVLYNSKTYLKKADEINFVCYNLVTTVILASFLHLFSIFETFFNNHMQFHKKTKFLYLFNRFIETATVF